MNRLTEVVTHGKSYSLKSAQLRVEGFGVRGGLAGTNPQTTPPPETRTVTWDLILRLFTKLTTSGLLIFFMQPYAAHG